uniref:Uncharacterized protein n=1 Tax=Monopterus albus TaxID=43700 RepID=A0A3Q3IMQ8_MONAL
MKVKQCGAPARTHTHARTPHTTHVNPPSPAPVEKVLRRAAWQNDTPRPGSVPRGRCTSFPQDGGEKHQH